MAVDWRTIQTTYSPAEVTWPSFGRYVLWFTAVLAIIATVPSVIGSVFAISRTLTTEAVPVLAFTQLLSARLLTLF